MRSFNINMHIHNATRDTKTSSTVIDYIASNFENTVPCDVFDPAMSDNKAISADISLTHISSKMNR